MRAGVRRDLAALNGVEVLPWDDWGRAVLDDGSLTGEDLAVIDVVAAARARTSCAGCTRIPGWPVPDEITSYTTYDGVRRVTLSARRA